MTESPSLSGEQSGRNVVSGCRVQVNFPIELVSNISGPYEDLTEEDKSFGKRGNGSYCRSTNRQPLKSQNLETTDGMPGYCILPNSACGEPHGMESRETITSTIQCIACGRMFIVSTSRSTSSPNSHGNTICACRQDMQACDSRIEPTFVTCRHDTKYGQSMLEVKEKTSAECTDIVHEDSNIKSVSNSQIQCSRWGSCSTNSCGKKLNVRRRKVSYTGNESTKSLHCGKVQSSSKRNSSVFSCVRNPKRTRKQGFESKKQNCRTIPVFESNSKRKNTKIHKNSKTDFAFKKDPRLYGFSWTIFMWITFLLSRLFYVGRSISRTSLSGQSRGLASKCIIFGLLTLIILPGQSKRRVFGNSLLINPREFCSRARFLNAKQQAICLNHSNVLRYVEEGILLGSKRCQNEFQYNRWNCTHSPKYFYSRLLNQDIRETAYLNAISSAAVTYAVTYACAKGKLAECGCGENGVGSYELLKREAMKRNMKVNESELLRAAAKFDWGGCGDNVDYGYRMSRIFVDNFGRKYQSRDLKSQIQQHNYEAGRLAIKNNMRKECRCHGFTGACSLETCWNRMPKWQNVGAGLRRKFDGAIRVHLSNDGRSLLPARKQRRNTKNYLYPQRPVVELELHRRYKRSRPGIYPPRSESKSLSVITDRDGSTLGNERTSSSRRSRLREQRRRTRSERKVVLSDESLVYAQESSNFCKRVRKQGILGTRGRHCQPHATGAGSCDYLCCGRAYTEHHITVTKPCNCKFEYCCEIKCEKCSVQETIYTCN